MYDCRTTIFLRALGRFVLAVGILCVGLVPKAEAVDGEREVVHLYFAHASRPFLVAEPRIMVRSGDGSAFGRQLLAELLAGSTRGNLSPVPQGTRIRSFFLLEEGTAVVDFSGNLTNSLDWSCRKAQLTLFSVVNSLVLNCPRIHRVKILIDGEQAQTLAGHLAIEFPLTADMLLTR